MGSVNDNNSSIISEQETQDSVDGSDEIFKHELNKIVLIITFVLIGLVLLLQCIR